MICGSGGSKSRLAKAAGCGASWPDERWKIARRCGAQHICKPKCTKHTSFGPLLLVEMSKKCTPLWREAHFQVKMYKTHQLRTTFGSWECRKSARRCGAKYISKSKCTKHTIVGPLLEVEMSKKCTPLWREAHFPSQNVQSRHTMYGPFLEVRCRFAWQAQGFCTCQKWAKREGFVAFPKTMAGMGHLKRICKDAFFVAGAVGNSRRYQFWKHDFQWSVCLFWPRSRVCSIWPCCYQCCRWNAGMMVFFLTHPCRVCVLHPFCLRHQSCNRRPTKENNAVGALAGIGFWSTTGDRCNGIW